MYIGKILGLAGSMQSGKNTCGNWIFARCLSAMNLVKRAEINKFGSIICEFHNGDMGIIDPFNCNTEFIGNDIFKLVKLYSFATELKNFCVNVLGLEKRQAWGTNHDKKSHTNIKWEEIPLFSYNDVLDIVNKIQDNPYNDRIIDNKNRGYMTAREVLQVVGTDIVRKINENAWVNATLNSISTDLPALAVITDVRFENEVKSIQHNGGKVIKLTRSPHKSKHESEQQLNNMNDDEFDYVIDNKNMTIEEQNNKLYNKLIEWGYNVWEI